ncbi:MAG: hypothetical protein OEY97_13250 [Nitrospirota bacterium]|nr:hypothetical protein [Nitrospirota bacterium]
MSDIQKQREALINVLPMAIEVPSTDEFDDPTYRPLLGPKGATVGELRLTVEDLRKRITDDLLKAEVLAYLLAWVASAGADDDARVSEIISRHEGDKK